MKAKLLVLQCLLMLSITTVKAENPEKKWKEQKKTLLNYLEDESFNTEEYIKALDAIVDLDKQQEKSIKIVYKDYFKKKKAILKSDSDLSTDYLILIKLNEDVGKDIKLVLTDEQIVIKEKYHKDKLAIVKENRNKSTIK